MNKHKRPLNRSITAGCIFFIILLCVLLNFANISLYKNSVYSHYREYIAALLRFSAAHIDGDDTAACIASGEESDTYRETLRFLDDVIDHFDDVHYLYVVRPLNTAEIGNTMSVFSAERYYDRYVDTEGNLYLGWVSEDEFDAATAAQFFDIMNGEGIVYFEEKTEWGVDYTGAMPIRDSQGAGVAVLAADIDISFLQDMIYQYSIVNICIIAVLGFAFIALFLLWSRRNITLPIRELEQRAVGFVDHSHGQRDVEALRFNAPPIRQDNEIKALSDAVVKMTQDMRDYVSDIISAEKKARSLQELANRDALTGIRNKTAYDHEIKRLDARLKNGETAFGLAIVDLNFLKKINDTYGHDKGNIAIVRLCQLVCNVFAHSSVFRIGGDEFAIILRGHDREHYPELQARFDAELRALADDPGLAPWEKVSAALGAAFYDSGLDDDIDSLFKRADHTMYDRKKEMKAARQEEK